jgi:hypothetical protein
MCVWIRNPHDVRILSLIRRDGHKIHIFLLSNVSLVLESTINDVMSYNLVLYIYFQHVTILIRPVVSVMSNQYFSFEVIHSHVALVDRLSLRLPS